MTSFPTGTVTFLFTDMQGSTQLLQQLGDKYDTLLARQQQILREACEANNGRVISTQGDSFFVAFSAAIDGVNAAVQAQVALADQVWPDDAKVSVRMGLHTGEPRISSSNYVGIDVHRAARIAAAGYGGQVLLSQTTCNLIEGELPDSVALLDLGEHHLKDLRQPKHLYQLVIAGLPSDFPPLKSLAEIPSNLPNQLTSFVGRSKEIGQVKQLISKNRLLTITGPGGCGKTRLALEVAAELIKDFNDGVFFVDLAPVIDPSLIVSNIVQSLGINEIAGQSILDSLKGYLQDRSILLLLDNFEQVVKGAPLVTDLLTSCSMLKVLVTSREVLHLRGEQEYPLLPMDLPDLTGSISLETLGDSTAVELFLWRARAVKPNFHITEDTAFTIAKICQRLDGLPLAIELAAARIKLLSPQAMLAHLEHRLDFLSGIRRDLPERQQTLRNAIAWSYDLLDENEKILFQRLSVFVSSCTLDAVDSVAAGDLASQPALDQLESLLDKSLMREVEDRNGQPRFIMLELLREFGQEQLEASGEQWAIRYRHADFFLRLSEQNNPKSEKPEQVQWMSRMVEEHDNLRAALEWSKTAKGAADICLRLANALGLFWEAIGFYTEGRERLSSILSLDIAQGHTLARASLLNRAAELAYRQSDYPATATFAAESLSICREVGDRQGIASALVKLANSETEVGENSTAAGYLDEALNIWRELDDKHGAARALISLGWIALRTGDVDLARARLEEALAISQGLDDSRSIGFELSGLGEIALRQGDTSRANRLVDESLELRRELGNKWGIGVSLGISGLIALRQGDLVLALARLGESLRIRQEIGDRGGCAWCFEHLAEVALIEEETEKAVRLLGAAESLRASIGSVIDIVDRVEYEKKRSVLKARLGEEKFSILWVEGQNFTWEHAVAYALDVQIDKRNID